MKHHGDNRNSGTLTDLIMTVNSTKHNLLECCADDAVSKLLPF